METDIYLILGSGSKRRRRIRSRIWLGLFAAGTLLFWALVYEVLKSL